VAHLSGCHFQCDIGDSGGEFNGPTQVVEVAHLSGCHFQCDIGDSGGEFNGPTQVVKILVAILVNSIGCFKFFTF
jgi:hypothetical protein